MFRDLKLFIIKIIKKYIHNHVSTILVLFSYEKFQTDKSDGLKKDCQVVIELKLCIQLFNGEN